MKSLGSVVAVAVVSLVFVGLAEGAVVERYSTSESNAAKSFWTPERIAVALKRDPAFKSRTSASQSGSSLRHRPVFFPRPEVGKILGWNRSGGFSCSGSVIDTQSLRLVLTAAHCVFNEGVWARKLIFMPNFRNGWGPYGTYRVKNMWVPDPWYYRSFRKGFKGLNYDMGVLVTRRTSSGRRIGQNVGAIPLQMFPDRSGTTNIYGYPGGAMRGRVMRTCRSQTKPDWYGGRLFPGPTGMLARCNMAAGSSGGPWVSRYENPNGNGTTEFVDGLTSTGFSQGGRKYLTSPYFGRLLRNLINSAEGR